MHLNEALKFINGHICKHPPTEVAVFHIESSQVRKIFRGNVHIKINIALDNQDNSAQQERLKRIRVDLCDYSFVPRKVNFLVRFGLLMIQRWYKAVVRQCLFAFLYTKNMGTKCLLHHSYFYLLVPIVVGSLRVCFEIFLIIQVRNV